jgi:predicted enzyme related to lactoylglutathione lyase
MSANPQPAAVANPIVWFEIYVQDMERAKRFYEAVLQTKLQKLGSPQSTEDIASAEMWQFSSNQAAHGASGALIKMAGAPSGGLGTVVYFHCNDCAVEESRVVKNGGRIHRSKTAIGEYGAISLVYDTEGNLFGLHSM